MKERGIIFSAPMVCALLVGAKTQTRRMLKNQWALIDGGGVPFTQRWDEEERINWRTDIKCPYGAPGDRLWVRETWAAADTMYHAHELDTPSTIAYFADRSARTMGKPVPGYDLASWNWDSLKKRPSIFMPRFASRITLEVTEVRVERLQDISQEDARAEGVPGEPSECAVVSREAIARGEETCGDCDPCCGSKRIYRHAYARLWDEINGVGSWKHNDWVWAISFKRVA